MSTAVRHNALDPHFLARLATSPDGYPQNIDLVRELVLCVEMSANAFRSASFLDDRILGPAMRGSWFPIDKLLAASQPLFRTLPVNFIFHTGHVGSTLVSRLLDETGRVLSLREPLPLRTLAEAADTVNQPESLLSPQRFDELLDMLLRLWSRGYKANEQVVVKATSSAGSLASVLLQRSSTRRAIYLNVTSETYLATLLAGANSPLDLRGHGPRRMRRLQSMTTADLLPLHAMSLGELAAMSWLVETLTQKVAVRDLSAQLLAVDFDLLLADVPVTMERILQHFGLRPDASYRAAIDKSGVLNRYSKAPDHVFTPSSRHELLNESRRVHSAQIRQGLSWIETVASADEKVAVLLR